MKSKFLNFAAPISIILFAVVLRLVPHPPNFAPIAALALFGGVYLDKKYALVVPLVVMIISDYFIGFHNTMPFVYVSFIFTGLIGMFLKQHKSPLNIFFGTLVSSLLFFAITNFGVWAMGTMYPKTASGLLEAYVMAIPFFRNTIVGDLFYTGLFFGSYELVKTLLLSRARAQIK